MTLRMLPLSAEAALDQVGGKAYNLMRLARAGLPVPPGFVVPTAAYTAFVEANGLNVVMAAALAAVSPADPLSLEAASRQIGEAFRRGRWPPGLAEAVAGAWAELGAPPVAVRSSATAEDLPDFSFAGQHETFLNVTDAEGLLEAVVGCWASLWTARAIAYRDRLGIDHRTVKMAVVVQQLVPAEFAGVLFTANPVTGAQDEVVIEATPGLGEALVADLVTPDHFVLRRRLGRWRIVERRPGRRELVIRPASAGGTEQVPAAGAESLPDRALARLAGLGKLVERRFGQPQDIEWAWVKGQVVLLQARPLTALPEPLPRVLGPLRLMAALLAELLPSRPSPLELTTWTARIYSFLVEAFGLLGLAAEPIDRLFIMDEGIAVRLRNRLPVRPTPAVLLAPLRLLRRTFQYDPTRWADDPLLAEARRRVRRLEGLNLESMTWAELLKAAREALAIPALVWEVRLRYAIPVLPALGLLRLLLGILGFGHLFGTLVFTGLETKILEMNRALEALAGRVRSDPELAELFARHEPADLWQALEASPAGRAFLAEVRAFLDEYGHRETGGSLLARAPTWKEEPEVVLGLIGSLARSGEDPRPGRPDWEAARDRVLAHPVLRIPGIQAVFLRLLDRARLFQQIREDTRFYVMLPLPVLRRILLKLGRRLAGAGILARADDVFYLRFDELEAVIAWPPGPEVADRLRRLVVRRNAKWVELEGTPVVDPRLLGGGAEPAAGVLLRGLPGSPGVAEGPVRVIRDPSEFGKFAAGEVLVAPYTNPAWTPLFRLAVAVVVDSGGPASHAAIVAREYGIPAVMGTGDATRRLTDGQRVRVDGHRGLVLRA